MDLNVKIIEAVKQCPILYDNYGLEERSQAWLQLADKLKINEQFLKVRWHYLLQRYQREVNFRYASQMCFLQNYINRHHVQLDNWPEFIITEEDLKAENPGEKEEFQYLTEANEVKDVSKATNQKGDNIKYTPKKDKNSKDEEMGNFDTKQFVEQEKNNTEHCSSYEVKNEIQADKEENCVEIPTNIAEKMEDVNVKKTVDGQTPAKKCANSEKMSNQENIIIETVVEVAKDQSEASNNIPKPPTNERCEDVIFGELVSAMLKRMDESKKNSIKKEIMNLLFS